MDVDTSRFLHTNQRITEAAGMRAKLLEKAGSMRVKLDCCNHTAGRLLKALG
jgi:Mg-chelatase subunit ChlD